MKNGEKTAYQIWLKAKNLKSTSNEEWDSDILFSTEFGKKSLFKIFKILKSEVKGLTVNEDNVIEIIYKQFAGYDLSSNMSIENNINKFMKKLYNYDNLIKKITNIFTKIRERRIQNWEKVLSDYSKDKEENNKKIKNLWIKQKIYLNSNS